MIACVVARSIAAIAADIKALIVAGHVTPTLTCSAPIQPQNTRRRTRSVSGPCVHACVHEWTHH